MPPGPRSVPVDGGEGTADKGIYFPDPPTPPSKGPVLPLNFYDFQTHWVTGTGKLETSLNDGPYALFLRFNQRVSDLFLLENPRGNPGSHSWYTC